MYRAQPKPFKGHKLRSNNTPDWKEAIESVLLKNDLTGFDRLRNSNFLEAYSQDFRDVLTYFFHFLTTNKSPIKGDKRAILKILIDKIKKLTDDEQSLIFSHVPYSKYGVLHQALVTKDEELFLALFDFLKINKESLFCQLKMITGTGFGVLQTALKSGSERMFEAVWEALNATGNEGALQKNLSNVTRDGFDVLQTALNSGSERMFEAVWREINKEKNKEILKVNLCNINKVGFSVLQTALNSGSERMFEVVWGALNATGNEGALQKNLSNVTRGGFDVLQTALNSGSERIFEAVWEALNATGNEGALQKNLSNFTKDNFGVLQHALCSGSEHMFEAVWGALNAKGNEGALQKNLSNFTKDAFGVLQHAICSGSERMFEAVWGALNAKGNEVALQKNLSNVTRGGFDVLQTALNSGSERMFEAVWREINKERNKEILKANLCNINKAGFSLLQQGLCSGSERIFEAVWGALNAKGNEVALQKNLSNFTNDRFGVLQQGLCSGSERIFEAVWGALNATGNEDALQKNLSNVTRDGFDVLQTALKSGSERMFEAVWGALNQEKYKVILEKNLSNITNDRFGVLQQALLSGLESMFNAVWGALNKNEVALQKNLSNFTNDGFGVLQTALNLGSERMFEAVWGALNATGNEVALQKNLSNFTNDGFGVLQQALNSGSERMFDVVWGALNKNEVALKENLSNVTRDGFGVLQTVLNSGSECMFDAVWGALNQEKNKEILEVNLRNITQDKFSVLSHALNSGSERMFDAVWGVLNEKRNKVVLEKNLSNVARDNFGVLQQALKSGSGRMFDAVWGALNEKGNEAVLSKNLNNIIKDGFSVLQQAFRSGSERMFSAILKKIKMADEETLKLNLKAVTKYGFHCVGTALSHASDRVVNELISLCQSKLERWEWQETLRRHNFFSSILRGNKASYTKIKIIAKTLIDMLGHQDAIEIIESKLPEKFFIKGKEYSRDNVYQDSFNYQLPTKDEDIRFVKVNFNEVDAIGNWLSERSLGYHDCVSKNKKGQSLLWFFAFICGNGNPDLFINTYQEYGECFQLEDIMPHREGEKSVLWYLLYACARVNLSEQQRLHLESIIEELWKKYPNAFVDYTPKGEEAKRRSQWVLLGELGELGKAILFEKNPAYLEVEDKITGKEEAIEEKETDEVEISAGIGSKYLGANVSSPFLPQFQRYAAGGREVKESKYYLGPISTVLLERDRRTPFDVNRGVYEAVFYSNRGNIKEDEAVTFVCAGRNKEALTPFHEKQGRIIWVLTEEEYRTLSELIPQHHDVLVNKKISGITGEFENLKLVTSRRLGIALFAHHAKLNHFVMMDDNIAEVHFASDEKAEKHKDWSNVYQLMQAQSQVLNKVCVSVATQCNKKKIEKAGVLGSKLFFINMQAIRDKLGNIEDMFLLFPPAREMDYWGEDYYFQIMLSKIFSRVEYQVIERSLIELIRSSNHRNAFLNQYKSDSNGKKNVAVVKTFSAPTIEGLAEEKMGWLSEGIKEINRIINDNILRRNRQDKQEREMNLLQRHAKVNGTCSSSVDASKAFENKSFQEILASLEFLDKKHYAHQVEALKAVAESDASPSRVVMATGTGKTRVQCELARVAYHTAKPGSCIIIVTSQINLVQQFYKDFIGFSQEETASNYELAIPKQSIVKVSSASADINVDLLIKNTRSKRDKRILIFCADSFNKFIPHLASHRPELILLDEYHMYLSLISSLTAMNAMPRIIGFSASPPSDEKEVLPSSIYSYSIAQGRKDDILAEICVKGIGCNYDAKKADDMSERLPDIIKEQQVNLAQKGVIYLPSIKACQKAYEVLSDHCPNLNIYQIHSGNKRSQKDIEKFKQESQGIILARDMAKVGFDDPQLSWEIILQSGQNEQQLIQMVGRVTRKWGDKIGCIISYDDVCDKIKALVGEDSNKSFRKKRECLELGNYENSQLYIPNANERKMNEGTCTKRVRFSTF